MDARLRLRLRDASVAVLAAAAALTVELTADISGIDPRLRAADPWSVALTCLAGLALYWWLRRPLVAVAGTTVAAALVALSSHYVGLLPWLMTAAIGVAAAVLRWRAGVVAAAGSWLVYTAVSAAGIPDNGGDAYVSTSLLLAVVWSAGSLIRLHRARVAADLTAAREVARAARLDVARAVAEERLRIARELHDVVAHSMSLIAVHAGVGAHLIHTRPDRAERALEVIADTSREALAQTRSILGVLRSPDPEESPAPVTAELDALVDRVRLSGLEVDMHTAGDPDGLPAATRLALYRIVQESLTNVVKHAKAKQAAVRLDYAAVSVEVTDDGTGTSPAGPGGHGLMGLRERAALLGGTLTAGPAADGGFRVRADLPVPS